MNRAENMSVLIVDDEYLVRLGLRTTIEWAKHGYILAGEAENGEEGLELALKLRPDIIVTDVSMPFMDGIEFMEQLRLQGMESKIIVLSGHDDFQYAKGAITYGASEYILKPIENSSFIAVVNEVAESIRKERLSEQLGKKKLVADLAVILKEVRNRKSASTPKIVEEAKRFIQQRFAEELTVSRIAEELFISPSYLMHNFKQHTGMTVNDFITECRINKAKQLLVTQNYKIYEVCEQIGIGDTRYFSQLFKRYTNHTPREYAKRGFSD